MDDINIDFIEKPELEEAIMIEGLPGVGNVGKLAVEHLIEEIEAEKCADIHSIYFPPQVLVDEDGLSKLVNNRLYYKKDVGEDDTDLLLLTGDYQGMTPQGQYKLTDEILSVAKKMGIDRLFSLGGYSKGEMVDIPEVLGAATTQKKVEEMEELDVKFSEEHPSSGIVGASGLLLGLGDKLYDISGVCLMGETSGYFVDPAAARVVLKTLMEYLKSEIGYERLDEKAEEVEELTNKVKDMDMGGMQQQESGSEDLNYIG
ncbi:MAG: proteasome assembly chaperone family protein [Candidatus Thermoplasmatota archaeon]|nr:proteasome assembly chaperone family protein [Candidatus Thermoplasmatota archaeon]